MDIEVILADYHNNQHAQHILLLMEAYAMDPMGGGEPLNPYAKSQLIEQLAIRSDAISFLAYHEKQPVGLVNCFESFSTFYAQPVINIHDIVVLKAYRRLGISHKLLEKAEWIAKEKNCCKLTLEVLSKNHAARLSYQKFGFESYVLDADYGTALFWQKTLI